MVDLRPLVDVGGLCFQAMGWVSWCFHGEVRDKSLGPVSDQNVSNYQEYSISVV
jgi:hypothetical protein